MDPQCKSQFACHLHPMLVQSLHRLVLELLDLLGGLVG